MPKIVKKMPELPHLEQPKRVAAYARVSSGKDAMLHSLSSQVSYYSTLIQQHPGWIFAGVYSDEALTGTKENRDSFQQLICDCEAGKIDMVITKSISRFARNTVTLLNTVRLLKGLGIDVYFEEQNIHSMTNDGELMLTILASYAQEESLSASENQKWRIQKNFESGKPWNVNMLGYRMVNGSLVIEPEEAEIVKSIFTDYLSGMGVNAIMRKLNAAAALTFRGNQWNTSSVSKVLKNYTYTGNLMLQQTFHENHLTKKMLINNGELPKYHVEKSHEAIIPLETFEAVQAEMARRAEKYNKTPVPKQSYPYTGLLVCGICGKHYKRKTTTTGVVWVCSTYNIKGKEACASKQIPESTLDAVTVTVLGSIGSLTDVSCIHVYKGNRLVYDLKSGGVIEQVWKDRSRSESWTDDMRRVASQKAMERNERQCQK